MEQPSGLVSGFILLIAFCRVFNPFLCLLCQKVGYSSAAREVILGKPGEAAMHREDDIAAACPIAPESYRRVLFVGDYRPFRMVLPYGINFFAPCT